MRTKYPLIEPNESGYLPVSSHHLVYWEESGNPRGRPILFLHGGPGSGTEPSHRSFFDPEAYRIILFDQRGCGKSRPHAELQENTTWDLISDIEKIREHLGISSWIVFGGSWGSTLALVYAQTHPQHVKGLILRGIFLGRAKELQWFYQTGTNFLFPDEWEKFIQPIPVSERENFIQAYYKRLASPDSQIRMLAARAWSGYEAATLRLKFDEELFRSSTEDARAEAIARIECHYFINRCFLKTDNWLIEHLASIRKIPAILVHGRYDVICPLQTAWELHQSWPESRLEIIPDAGHSASEPGITDALIRATDSFRIL
jgi:proline iminopeptidase